MVLIFSCKNDKPIDPQFIVDKSIEVSGGLRFKKSTIDFDFRDRHYKALRNHGKFHFERIFNDTLGEIKDVLNNSGFQRFVDGEEVKVTDSMIPRYSASVNAVHYFSVLPYGLNDKAVNKTYLGEIKIKGQNYHKIKVTFNEVGGGADFEDEFIYWIHDKTFKTNYLAYSYRENDGMGFRFREAFNERFVSGIRFVDYNNYKPRQEVDSVEVLDRLFVENQLKLLSKIELKRVSVN